MRCVLPGVERAQGKGKGSEAKAEADVMPLFFSSAAGNAAAPSGLLPTALEPGAALPPQLMAMQGANAV